MTTRPNSNPHIAKAVQSVAAAAPRAAADPQRPIYHFVPPANWMNDPNGPIYHDGWHHLFYQFNPYGDDWGFMHWGHARSRDLVHWEHLPIALAPAYEQGEEHVFSGCACSDGSGKLLLLYTSVKQGTPEDRPPNEQWAARPLDPDLITWERHPDNPVLSLESHGGPPLLKDWRDPFVFTAGGRTLLVLGAETETDLEVPLYEAFDDSLLRWTYRGSLIREARGAGPEPRFLECPNFVLAPPSDEGGEPQWLLLISPYDVVEYTTGAFDPATLQLTPHRHGILDAGRSEVPNFYATNLLQDADGNLVLLGWARGFAAGRGWAGALALPRILTVDADGTPRQRPHPALQSLRGEQTNLGPVRLQEGSTILPPIRGDALELTLTLHLEDAAAAGLRLRCADNGTRGIDIRWDGAALTVGGCSTPLAAENRRTVALHIFLDKCLLEVFAAGGRTAITRIAFAPNEDLAMAAFAEGGEARIEDLIAWQMGEMGDERRGTRSGDSLHSS